jgi:hypothetical protein
MRLPKVVIMVSMALVTIGTACGQRLGGQESPPSAASPTTTAASPTATSPAKLRVTISCGEPCPEAVEEDEKAARRPCAWVILADHEHFLIRDANTHSIVALPEEGGFNPGNGVITLTFAMVPRVVFLVVNEGIEGKTTRSWGPYNAGTDTLELVCR